MLRLQSSSAVLPISRLSSITAFNTITTPTRSMSTDGTVRPPHGGRVADAPDEIKHQAELKPSHAFLFPLGYKDAAYQWVCNPTYLRSGN